MRAMIPRRVAALLLLAVPLGYGCGEGAGDQQERAGPGGEPGEGPIPAVEAIQARHGNLPLRERLTGTVRAAGQVAIYPQVVGPITEVLVQNGDQVQRGDPLVRIRAETSSSQVAQARANLDITEAEARAAEANLEEFEAQFQRTRTLAEEDLVSAEALETQRAQVESARANEAQARARVEQAQATLEERREALGQTVVRAPITGQVGQRNAEVGMQANGQTSLFTIGRLDEVRVEVAITQDMLGRLAPGQRVEIQAENLPDTALTARVSRISPFLEEGSFSTEAEIDVSNPAGRLIPGMFVTVDVFYGESEQATLVPTSALYENPATGEQGIVIASGLDGELQPADDDGLAPFTPPTPTHFRTVEVVAEGDQTVGIRGVEAGTWVVVVGQHLLTARAEDEPVLARVRPIDRERIVGLQSLQRQDLLREFMEKQQRLARERGDSIGESGEGAGSETPSGS